MRGIGEALISGDGRLAARILRLTLQVQWVRVLGRLGKLHARLRRFTWGRWYDLRRVWLKVSYGISVAWIETGAALKQGRVSFLRWFRSNFRLP